MNDAYASGGQRLSAYLVDVLIGTLLWAAFFVLVLVTRELAVALLFYVVAFVYGGVVWWLTAKKGYTPGKKALGIRVVDEATLQPIGWGRAFLRSLVFGLEAALCGIPLLITGIQSGSHPKRQTWHDQAARSVVVPAEAVQGLSAAGTAPASLTATAGPGYGSASASAPPLPPAPVPPLASPVSATSQEPLEPPVSAPPVAPPMPAVPPASPGMVGPPPAGGTGAPPIPPMSRPPTPTPPPPPPPTPSVTPPPDPAHGVESEVDEHTTVVRPRRSEWTLRDAAGPIGLTGPTLVGRDPDVSLVADSTAWRLDDPERTVSKTHALFGLEDGRPFIEDWASTNGVVVIRDGVEIELAPRTPTALLPGDEVRLGEHIVRIEGNA